MSAVSSIWPTTARQCCFDSGEMQRRKWCRIIRSILGCACLNHSWCWTWGRWHCNPWWCFSWGWFCRDDDGHLECEIHRTGCVHWAQRWQCDVGWTWLHGFLWEWESVHDRQDAACWWCGNFQTACHLLCLLGAWLCVLKQSKREAMWRDKNACCQAWRNRRHLDQTRPNIFQNRTFFLQISWISQCEMSFSLANMSFKKRVWEKFNFYFIFIMHIGIINIH